MRGEPGGGELWTCPRHIHHTAIRDHRGGIWCCACEYQYAEGQFLPEDFFFSASAGLPDDDPLD